jgi:hypothetical protein
MGLMKAHAATRQTGMYAGLQSLRPPDPTQKPTKVFVRAAYTDFFPMFDVPFKYGGPWTASDDESRAAVVVITRETNDRLFGGINSVGKTIRLDNEPYRVSGVLDEWRLLPRFYDLAIRPFGDGDAKSAEAKLFALDDNRILKTKSMQQVRTDAYRGDHGLIVLLSAICTALLVVTAFGGRWAPPGRRS